MAVAEMLYRYPTDLGQIDRDLLVRCIEECLACAQTCTACADSCLAESDADLPNLRKCISLNQDCADICDMTARILSRHTSYDNTVTRAVLEACAALCRACGDECELHAAKHDHCRVCTDACRRCERACRELIVTLG